MDYYNEIKNKLIDNEIYAKVKDYSKERYRVLTYFETGKLLAEAGKVYGEDIIGQYSKKLVVEVGKKYNRSTLFRMRQFYLMFKSEKVAPMARQLSWSHYVELLPIRDEVELLYYVNIAVSQNLSRNNLREKIKNKEYERLDEKTKLKLLNDDYTTKVTDFVKHPILIKNKYDKEKISEKMLKRLIMEDLPSFMKELGEGFSFIDKEYKIKIGNKNGFIDLLLYNIKYDCYVVVELKVTEIKKEHLGQIQVYMNYIDNHLRKANQDKTIGIIIVKKENEFLMEYCSDSRIYETEYKLVKNSI